MTAERRDLRANDRVSIEADFHELYTSLVERSSKNPETTPFVVLKDAFMWAVALGVRAHKRTPLSGKRELFFWHQLSQNQDVPALEMLAIAETGDVAVLSDGDEILRIAEEYANSGIRELRREIVDKGGTPLWNLVDIIREGQGE